MPYTLTREQRRFFRDQLRDARAAALLDAEGFQPIVAALERLGSALCPICKNLGEYRKELLLVAHEAKPASALDDDRSTGTPPEVLLSVVKNGRNDAVHQGAHARHLVRHCVELALVIEEGLMADFRCVADFMVRDPACAQPWQQVAIARQIMLTSSFSNLPISLTGEWKLLSDYAIASYMSRSANPREALRMRIEEVFESGALTLDPAVVLKPDVTIEVAVRDSAGRPVLVVNDGQLLGIATPFDFL